MRYTFSMEKNNVYNLMHQLTQESKSLWRIKHNYQQDAVGEEEKVFWTALEKDKESHIEALKRLIAAAL